MNGKNERTNVRSDDLRQFYNILADLERKTEGARLLTDCSGSMKWPERGVYFFREIHENRSGTGDGARIVRVGTHALKAGARTTLWGRLRQHKGTNRPVGGNHRGSIFRSLVGRSLIERDVVQCPSWGRGSTASRAVREAEAALEREVSAVIGAMPFLWLAVEDEPGPGSMRGYIERNAIALLSNYHECPLDLPSRGWLGSWCDRERVRKSGLWNSNHVDEHYRPEFLEILESCVEAMRRVR